MNVFYDILKNVRGEQKLSKDIIGKVREAENLIDSMKVELADKKEAIRENEKEKIETYRKELEQSLDGIASELEQERNQELAEVRERVNYEVDNYRRHAQDDYQTHKGELIQAGIKEVMSQYGNFSHEAGNNHRGASE